MFTRTLLLYRVPFTVSFCAITSGTPCIAKINKEESSSEDTEPEPQFSRDTAITSLATVPVVALGTAILLSRATGNDGQIGNGILRLYFLESPDARRRSSFGCDKPAWEYSKALKFARAFLQIEPRNQQVQNLETLIKKRVEKEGLIGMALAGGAILAIGGLLGLGIALTKGRKDPRKQ